MLSHHSKKHQSTISVFLFIYKWFFKITQTNKILRSVLSCLNYVFHHYIPSSTLRFTFLKLHSPHLGYEPFCWYSKCIWSRKCAYVLILWNPGKIWPYKSLGHSKIRFVHWVYSHGTSKKSTLRKKMFLTFFFFLDELSWNIWILIVCIFSVLFRQRSCLTCPTTKEKYSYVYWNQITH